MEKAPSVSDLFISLVIISTIYGTIFLNRLVGIGSVSQVLVFIALMVLITSSSVTGVRLNRGVILSSDGSYLGCPSKLDLIFSIFSMKKSANIFAKSSSDWLGGNGFSDFVPVKLATRTYKPSVSCLQSFTLSVSVFPLIDFSSDLYLLHSVCYACQ